MLNIGDAVAVAVGEAVLTLGITLSKRVQPKGTYHNEQAPFWNEFWGSDARTTRGAMHIDPGLLYMCVF